MLNSVVSRLAIFIALGLMLLAVPIAYLLSAEDSAFKAKSIASAETTSSEEGVIPAAVEDTPVVQLASLTVVSDKPSLEILEPIGSLKSDTGARVERASELAKAQRFDEALAVLDAVHSSSQNEYSVEFLEARIFAWSGQHRLAEQAFANLRTQYPQDLDIMVSSGYLQFYQRNYASAEKIFSKVLALNPDYSDARRGLERSKSAQNKR